jgi:hypothetical protein
MKPLTFALEDIRMNLRGLNTARRVALAGGILAALTLAAPALAANAPTTASDEMRLFQQFFTDAAMASQWWEGQLRLQWGTGPRDQQADGFQLGGVLAVSPWKKVEVGGRFAYANYNLDNSVRTQNGNTIDSESGATDLDLFGKYRVLDGDIKVAVGGELTLPTGSENDGLGTGEVVPAVFGAVRSDLSSSKTGAFTGVAHLGFRFNGDPTILGVELNGKTSIFLGAGVLVRLKKNFGWSGELTIESQRYDHSDSDIRATGGVHWDLTEHQMLRGAAAVGLSDEATGFELIGSYVYHF